MKTLAISLAGLLLLGACSSKTDPGSGSPAVSATPAPEKAPPADAAKKLALDALATWVKAQNEGKVDAYLAHYDAVRFQGISRTTSRTEQKLGFAAWKEQRIRMMATGVTVAAEGVQAVSWAERPSLGEGVVEVTFTQRWKNPRYADHGPKTLRFRVIEGAAWIIYEELVSSTPGWDDSSAADAAGADDAGAPDASAPDAGARECTGDMADSELPCTLKGGRVGWCKGGACKDVCPAGFSYNPTDTRCHLTRDCKPPPGDGPVTPVKTARCKECLGMWCMDPDASRDML